MDRRGIHQEGVEQATVTLLAVPGRRISWESIEPARIEMSGPQHLTKKRASARFTRTHQINPHFSLSHRNNMRISIPSIVTVFLFVLTSSLPTFGQWNVFSPSDGEKFPRNVQAISFYIQKGTDPANHTSRIQVFSPSSTLSYDEVLPSGAGIYNALTVHAGSSGFAVGTYAVKLVVIPDGGDPVNDAVVKETSTFKVESGTQGSPLSPTIETPYLGQQFSKTIRQIMIAGSYGGSFAMNNEPNLERRVTGPNGYDTGWNDVAPGAYTLGATNYWTKEIIKPATSNWAIGDYITDLREDLGRGTYSDEDTVDFKVTDDIFWPGEGITAIE